ncbi:ribosome maturation factor RimP [Streptomyces cocklensis]|uniref:Ribosome maturation factor RimP n=1 Tax=Actinacidiphila cocklensis TaxID=887465 RepID=A0A9W4GQI8_9ACTN|nr:ribosome maturation factor RimP [Actinacidiphila cocklensis]MDD1060030.1 ribosome maturation factor RimP [Actinacidiphila cocklensis]CAG6391601.1 Ribosome maturation factor RimP [Actinacidiphila cocklensis]
MSTTPSERLRALLEPLAGEAGLDLEEVTLTASGRRRQLLVVVDAEDGVELDAVAALSRAVSQALDDSDVMGEAEYVLEVTSPGTDRPLTEPRHFRRNAGRLVKLSLKERGELIARIMAVDETGLDLEVPGVKGRKPKPARADFAEIAKARVEVEFNRKAGEPDDLGDGLDDGDDGDGSDIDGGSDIDESTQEA